MNEKALLFVFFKLDETPSWLDWLNGYFYCNQANDGKTTKKDKQRFRQWQTRLSFSSFSKWERRISQKMEQQDLSFFTVKILDFSRMTISRAGASIRISGDKMEKYLLLANRQCSKMNILRNECCFYWVLECLIKSNQIKSYFPISHVPYTREYPNHFPDNQLMWVKEDLNNHNHNTIHISFHFYLLFMINVLS